jgi:hypothetical protein
LSCSTPSAENRCSKARSPAPASQGLAVVEIIGESDKLEGAATESISQFQLLGGEKLVGVEVELAPLVVLVGVVNGSTNHPSKVVGVDVEAEAEVEAEPRRADVDEGTAGLVWLDCGGAGAWAWTAWWS